MLAMPVSWLPPSSFARPAQHPRSSPCRRRRPPQLATPQASGGWRRQLLGARAGANRAVKGAAPKGQSRCVPLQICSTRCRIYWAAVEGGRGPDSVPRFKWILAWKCRDEGEAENSPVAGLLRVRAAIVRYGNGTSIASSTCSHVLRTIGFYLVYNPMTWVMLQLLSSFLFNSVDFFF